MKSKRALVCAPLMPEFDRESGSRRTFDLIDFLREAGWAVSFVAQNGGAGQRYARLLRQRGVATYSGFQTLSEEFLSSHDFDLALLHFWYIAEECLPQLRRLSPRTQIIVDSIDLHFLRTARRVFTAWANAGNGSCLDSDQASEMSRELNVYAAVDAVLTVSQKEADLLNDFLGDSPRAHTVPDSEDLAVSRLPFAERHGVVFVGNFRHPPNLDAAAYLCKEIVPRLDPALLAEHPIYIVGNALNDTVRSYGQGLSNVQMVGWVPSLSLYLERARLSVIPLLYGAGTKRKLIHALMVGTPSVATSVGVEGLDLSDGEHVLVADDPDTFAGAIERLLEDRTLWQRLAARGREHVTARHGRAIASRRLSEVVAAVLRRGTKPPLVDATALVPGQLAESPYHGLTRRLREVVQAELPADATVLVVSRGDPELIQLDGRKAWHFPRDPAGHYAGHHPADSTAAITHLEELRAQGADYLLFPATAFWWLEHYGELRAHLEQRYSEVVRLDDVCRVFALRELAATEQSMREPSLDADPN